MATNIGSFADRLEHKKTGILVTPIAPIILSELKSVLKDTSLLDDIKKNIAKIKHKTIRAMIQEYHRIIPLESKKSFDIPLKLNMFEQYQKNLINELGRSNQTHIKQIENLKTGAENYLKENQLTLSKITDDLTIQKSISDKLLEELTNIKSSKSWMLVNKIVNIKKRIEMVWRKK